MNEFRPTLLRDRPGQGRDVEVLVRDEEEQKEEHVRYYCAGCGHEITTGEWRIAMGGAHEHVFFNPVGIIFRVLCFKEAPGLRHVGDASDEFTWFKDYSWRFGLCQGCNAHLGWRYEGEAPPRGFFGLIQDRLTTKKDDQ